MEKNELIVKQALEIEEQKKKFAENEKNLKSIKGRFISIGQPLNDNCLKFNQEQLKWAQSVYELIELLH